MSKYNIGDGFIITIDDIVDTSAGTIYLMSDFNTLVFDDYGLDRLPRTAGTITKIQSKTYEDGLADAWEEAIAKLREWEESREIKRGDEVEYNAFSAPYNRTRGIVISVDTDSVLVMGKGNCNTAWLAKGEITKTGRNFASQLDALLGEIGGGE